MEINIPFIDRKKMKNSELVILFESMSFMISAGFSEYDSLSLLIEDESNKISKFAIKGILNSMDNGMSFPHAFHDNEQYLRKGYWRQLEAADRTGKLPECLLRLSAQIKANSDITSKVRGALAYPAFVLLIAMIAGYVMFTGAVPEMADMMAEFDAELPLMTQAMMGVAQAMINYWYYMLALLIIAIVSFLYSITHKLKFRWDRFVTKMPLIGPIMVNLSYSTAYRIISDMIENGANSVEALTVANGSVVNAYIHRDLQHCQDMMVQNALEMSEALGYAETIPNDDKLMLKVGQRTGRTIDILPDLATHRRAKAIESVDILLEMMNPLIMAVVCAIVGILVVSIYMPMITISQTIG